MKISKKKKIFALLSLVLISYFLYSYTSLEKKYEIINEIIVDNDLRIHEICSESNKVDYFTNNLAGFSLISQPSVYFQKFFQIKSEFKKNKIRYFNKNLNKTVYTEIINNCNEEYRISYQISIPIVSPDKKTVLIKIEEICNCLLGGQSGEYLYEKIDGKWILIKSYNNWIS